MRLESCGPVLGPANGRRARLVIAAPPTINVLTIICNIAILATQKSDRGGVRHAPPGELKMSESILQILRTGRQANRIICF